MGLESILLSILSAGVLVLCIFSILLFRRIGKAEGNGTESLLKRLDASERGLLESLSLVKADMAGRLEKTRGDLRQDTADRLNAGFLDILGNLDRYISSSRKEQLERLDAISNHLQTKFDALRNSTEERLRVFSERQTEELAKTTRSLDERFEGFGQRTSQSIEAIRAKVDERLLMISQEVQKKLDDNIREGFSQFEKVQEHLKAAEERLKEVGVVGASINDLNNLLKLPHLRGRFGEVSLERLLSDFLPAGMYEMQTSASGDSRLRPDAVIHFPDRTLPIDSKFPREQVQALFASSDPAKQNQARADLVRVIKEQARSIARYIKPEEGTTDMALMYLPSETLWFEVIQSSELTLELSERRIFPVSPNTLLLALHSISLVYKWYQVAKGFEKTTAELAKAQKSFGYFYANFEKVGKDIGKMQESYQKAANHLTRYQNQVVRLTGEEPIDNVQSLFAEAEEKASET